MAYALVLLVSLLVGSAVYLGTVRGGRPGPLTLGFGGGTEISAEGADDDLDGGYTYLRVHTRGPSWQDRVQGVVGLVLLLAVGAAGLAFGIYQLAHLISITIERFLKA